MGYDEIRRVIREEEPPKPSTRISTLGQAATTVSTNRKSDPKRLRQLMRGELDWIVMKCLEKDRNRRYESASAFAADVQRYLHDEPVQACPPSAWYRFRKFARRNKAKLAIGGLIVLVVVLVGSGLSWVAGEQAARRAKVAEGFDDALSRVLVLMEEGNWSEAKAASQRAAGLLSGEGGDELRRQRLSRVEADLNMVAKVELARTQQAVQKGEGFDFSGAAPAYAEAFRDYDLPVLELEAEEAARRITASPIRTELLAVVWDWSTLAEDRAVREKLKTVIDLADKTPWRQQVSDALMHKDWAGLARLAQQPETFRQAPARLVVLGNILAQTDLPRAVEFFQQAQQRHPSDFWINHGLAFRLTQMKPPRLDEAIGFYRAALALHPLSTGVHHNLGIALHARGRLAEAEAEFQEAVRLSPDYSRARHALGNVLTDRGLLDEAITELRDALRVDKQNDNVHTSNVYTSLSDALLRRGLLDQAIDECRKALRLNKENAQAHTNLGAALRGKGLLDQAIDEHREAIRLSKGSDCACTNLGNALMDKGLLDEAIDEYRNALRLNKDFPLAHANLGMALEKKGRLDEALDEYREAIRLNKDDAETYCKIGVALQKKGRPDEALAAYDEALRLKPGLAEAHVSRGIALGRKGRLDEAVADFNKAIRLKPGLAEAHHNLGSALQMTGRLDQAIAAFEEAIRLKPGDANTRADLKTARELLELDTRLAKVLSGERQPANAGERAKLAYLCAQPYKQLTATAARFYAEAFAVEPKLAEDLRAEHRYNAACVAVLAAAGQGQDAQKLDPSARDGLRQQALDWLRADLTLWNKHLENGSPQFRTALQATLEHWRLDSDLAGIRAETALAQLAADEQAGWRRLWVDVDNTLAKARGSTITEKK
jgi:tetratricopeptide (TPR) repeat protein